MIEFVATSIPNKNFDPAPSEQDDSCVEYQIPAHEYKEALQIVSAKAGPRCENRSRPHQKIPSRFGIVYTE